MLFKHPIINAPAKVPIVVPTPPEKLVPPTMAAVKPSISYPTAPFGNPALTRDIKSTPAIPTKTPLIMKTMYLFRFTEIPDAIAASSFPPMAYKERPSLVCLKIYQITIVITTINKIEMGTGPILPCPKTVYLPNCGIFCPFVNNRAIPLAAI